MNKKLDKLLCKRYPKLFANRNKPMTETCMCWGFDCQEGWFWLIDNLCHALQSHIDNCHPHPPQVVVDQVKEKFGLLRFYYHGGDQVHQGMVDFAERLSGVICEACGGSDPAKIGTTTRSWVKTCCKECIPDLLNNDPEVYRWKSLAACERAAKRKKDKAAKLVQNEWRVVPTKPKN